MYITHPDTPAFFVDYHNLRKNSSIASNYLDFSIRLTMNLTIKRGQGINVSAFRIHGGMHVSV